MKEAIDHTRQMLMDTEERKARRQELLEKNRIFTLANLLSLIRLLLLPFVLACLLANRSDYDLLALNKIVIEGVQRMSRLHQNVIGHINDVVYGANTNGLQPGS